MQKIYRASRVPHLLGALITLSLFSSCAHTPKTNSSAPTPPTTSATTPTAPGASPAASVAPTVVHDGRFEVIPLVGDFKLKRVILPNGLKLIILKDDTSPTFAYETWFNVGSRNEVVGKTGLAHLFEHLMFKGTTHHKEGEFDSLLEQSGVEGENAFTSNDHTAYVQELPKDRLDLIMGLESDRMVNLIVNDDSFKTEREVVQNERRFREENSPEGTLYNTLFGSSFLVHPYHWPVIGYEQDLNIMNAQDARDFYEKHYSPDHATVVVVGDVDEEEVLKKVEKYYGSIPAKNVADVPPTPEPEQTAQRRKKMVLPIQVEKLMMVYKIPPFADPVSPVFEVIQAILTDGMNSRLNRALVDSGISANVSSGSFSLKDPGLFSFFVDMQKGKTASVAEPIILREIERLKANPVGDEELKRAKNLIRFEFYERLATSNGKAHFIGEGETTYGNVQDAITARDQIQTVTAQQVQDAVNKYFDTTKLTVVVGVPKK
jgi:zinc protease